MKTKGWMIGLLVATLGFAAFGQDENEKIFTANGGVDLFSMYLWRTFQLGNGAALHPWDEVTAKGIILGPWAHSHFSLPIFFPTVMKAFTRIISTTENTPLVNGFLTLLCNDVFLFWYLFFGCIIFFFRARKKDCINPDYNRRR